MQKKLPATSSSEHTFGSSKTAVAVEQLIIWQEFINMVKDLKVLDYRRSSELHIELDVVDGNYCCELVSSLEVIVLTLR